MSFTGLYGGEETKKNCGVVIGIVTNNKDPDLLGRVKLKFPWRDSSDESNWARVATLMAGDDRGTFFLPEVGDEVLVSFDHGDITQPYVIGALWNGKDKPPEKNADGKNNVRMIKSRSGHKIILNDEQGSEKVEVKTKSGHQIILDDSGGNEKIEIKDKTGSNSILIDSAQNSISMSSQMKITIQAQMIEIKAGATLTLQGGLVKIN
jgi:uncharacterized protein involved in type VI secretion and phage assembly